MKKYDLSIILPSINPKNWRNIYDQILGSIGKYSFELIIVGPFFPLEDLEKFSNIKFIRDFGCPSRSLQIGTLVAEGEYLTNLPDDCIIEEQAYSKCLSFIKEKDKKDGLIILYSEGPRYSGVQHLQPEYWVAWTHPDLRLKHVKDFWKSAPAFLYNSDYFREIGGLDCRFEHINLNTHDLAFRIQRDGGSLHYSPGRVFASDWVPWNDNNKSPIQLSYELNDAPLFKKIYNSEEECPIHIDYNNWKNAETIWSRRFTVNTPIAST